MGESAAITNGLAKGVVPRMGWGMDVTVPLVDFGLARELYGVEQHGDATEVRTMFCECLDDVLQRVAVLRTQTGQVETAPAVRELHQLRGAVGNFAMQRAMQHLGTLEREWPQLMPSAREAALATTENDIRSAAAELRRRYPYLAAAQA